MIRELEIRQARPVAYGAARATGMSPPIPQTPFMASTPTGNGGGNGVYASGAETKAVQA